MLYTLAVLVVSVAPALAFLVLILALDRREPEPLALVLKVIGLGAVSAIPAAIVEMVLEGLPLFSLTGIAGAAAVAFIQVAPVEEACKLAVVLLYAWRKPAFNEENDGIVYAGASAIGFALLENVIYVARLGLGTGAARAFSAIPLHVFTAVLVGLASAVRASRRPAQRGTASCWGAGSRVAHPRPVRHARALGQRARAPAAAPARGTRGVRRHRPEDRAPAVAGPVGRAPARARCPPAAAPRPRPSRARTHRWMPVVSRVLLAASAAVLDPPRRGLRGSPRRGAMPDPPRWAASCSPSFR